MKNTALIFLLLALICPNEVFAQIDLLGVNEIEENNTQTPKENNKSVPEADFFSGFIEDIEAEKASAAEAEQMLNAGPKILKLRPSQIKEMEKNKIEREKLRQKFLAIEQEKMKPEEKVQNILENYELAPLGLSWAITPEKMRETGYEIEKIEREDYSNSYIIKNSTNKNIQGYENVLVSFGENNALWCINAQTPPQKDDPSARETLKLYNKYFDALNQKYGNAIEHFTPYSFEQEIAQGDGENAEIKIIKKENPRGNPDFLAELQTGKAELYSTFHNNTIGVTLSVYVDENSRGQLVLDYKNLPLMKKEKEAFINNL